MTQRGVMFPGQGAQVVGMGRDVYDSSPAARAVFETADRVLPFSLSEIIFSGPQEKLTETDISQPAILTTSIALVEAAAEAGWDRAAAACAGLSLGEYSALVFAGVLDIEDAIMLVHRRGAYMREAGRKNLGGMLSVIGLDDAGITEILNTASSSGVIAVANLNCPGQVVLSGEMPALQAAETLAAEKGAMKTVFLQVDGAFHSPLMSEAAEKLAADLLTVTLKPPRIPFVANVTAGFTTDPGQIRSLLAAQVTSSVLWEKSMRMLIDDGVDSFAEIGPGRVLTGLMKRIERKIPVKTVSNMDQVAAFACPQ